MRPHTSVAGIRLAVTLAAQKVYSLFLMGDVASPVAVLRKDR